MLNIVFFFTKSGNNIKHTKTVPQHIENLLISFEVVRKCYQIDKLMIHNHVFNLIKEKDVF